MKVTTRSADDWPTLGIAVSLRVEGGVVLDSRIVASAATETPVRLSAAERVLRGAAITDELLKHCGEAAASEAQLVADARGSAAYKSELLRVYAARAVRAVLAQ